MNKGKALLLALLVGAAGAWWAMRPHGTPRHPMPPLPRKLDPAVLADVGKAYDRDVQPLFKGACFDCHTTNTVWPWYHALPGVRQFLDGHVAEGRRALDMSDGFPFNHGASVLKDLRRIAGNVKRGSMPLASYKLMHPDARLSDEQRAVIVQWAQDGFDRLTSTAQDAMPAAQGAAGTDQPHHRHHHEPSAPL